MFKVFPLQHHIYGLNLCLSLNNRIILEANIFRWNLAGHNLPHFQFYLSLNCDKDTSAVTAYCTLSKQSNLPAVAINCGLGFGGECLGYPLKGCLCTSLC